MFVYCSDKVDSFLFPSQATKQPTMSEAFTKARGQKRKAKEPVVVSVDSEEDEEASFDRILDTQSKPPTKPKQGVTSKAIRTVKSPAKSSKVKEQVPKKRVKATLEISSEDDEDEGEPMSVVQRQRRAGAASAKYAGVDPDDSDDEDDDDDDDFML